MSLKSVLKSWLRPLPQWAAVAIEPPQQAISVSLDWSGHSIDVTTNNTIASLRPLAVAIGSTSMPGIPAHATLAYRDNALGTGIGHVALKHSARRTVGGTPIEIFDIEGADQRCLGWPQKPWNTWLQSRAIRRDTNPHNFQMAPAAVQQLMTFYICPRPVVLVTVSAEKHSNIFPMDLIGPLTESCFTFALRNTSISVGAMVETGRFAISGIGAEHKDAVYKLGEHHKRAFADWGALPFASTPTRTFGIPAIASALWISELVVEHSEEIGSHTFFVCRVVSRDELSRGLQLHHTAGFHQEFRRRQGRAFASA